MASGLYDQNGKIRTTQVPSGTLSGVYANDGSINISLDDNLDTGIYAPNGSIRVSSAVGTTSYDPSGAFYSNRIFGAGTTLTGGITLSYPMDQVTGSPVWTACYGVCALTSAWNSGKLFDVIVSGSPVTINAINGYPDVKTLAAQMTVSSTKGVYGLLVSKWYDQSGNVNDAIQATTANQPYCFLINGNVYIAFSGVLATSAVSLVPAFLNIPSSFTLDRRSVSLFALAKPYTDSSTTSINDGTNTNQTGRIFSTATSGLGFDYPVNAFIGGSAPWMGIVDDITPNFSPLTANNFTASKSVVGMVCSATDRKIICNGSTTLAGSANPAGTTTGAFIGANGNVDGFGGRLQALIISSTVFSGTQETLLKNALYTMGGVQSTIPTTVPTNILISGASFDENQGGDPMGLYPLQNGGGYGWAEMLMDSLAGSPIQWHNMSVSGATIANCTTHYTSIGETNCFNAAATKNIIFGVNSAVGNSLGAGRTGAQAYSDFLLWLTAVKAQAWTKIVTYLFPNGGAEQTAYNNLMRANAIANGVTLIDFNALLPTLFTDSTNVSGDGVHPSVLGHQRMCKAIFPTIKSLI